MKKQPTTLRRHGAKARVEHDLRRLHLQFETDTHGAQSRQMRLKTLLTFEPSLQSFLWSTDRGRSKLIKH